VPTELAIVRCCPFDVPEPATAHLMALQEPAVPLGGHNCRNYRAAFRARETIELPDEYLVVGG
jgi:hypothetical protein